MQDFGYPDGFTKGESGAPDRPYFFAAMQTYNGEQTATLREGGVTDGGFKIRVENEGSAGDQPEHPDETLAYMTLYNDAFTCDQECQDA
jgi:hypothetical protein